MLDLNGGKCWISTMKIGGQDWDWVCLVGLKIQHPRKTGHTQSRPTQSRPPFFIVEILDFSASEAETRDVLKWSRLSMSGWCPAAGLAGLAELAGLPGLPGLAGLAGLARWLVGWLVSWLFGWRVGWLAG